ncbi:3-dehydroquinate synthase [Treponema medium]|uniref:3-dehydroquinate synthase n=1 Tax=Treponema medium TaxID=58231 RepID=UPI0019818398|nr:3-dehydroquinate synthase family protein [Treponema medium]QSH93023.1 3-dehydroquinate synthase [Treponema medium]
MKQLPQSFSFSTPHGTTQVWYSDTIRLPQLSEEKGRVNALYVCDEHTLPLLRQAEYFSVQVPLVVLPAGDEAKNLRTLALIAEKAAEYELDRQACFVAFGGGVVCDITALAASLYMRGVQCILVPTTVLAMADASIGGKTAVNLSGYKNLIGTFYAASSIILCFPVLHSLPEAEYRSGLAEILKIAVLYDTELYQMFVTQHDDIIHRDSACISRLIRRAAEAKARVVERDFTEQGERAFLNFGHTFAHALESLAHFSIPHGDAVAWGMSRALAVGLRLQLTDKNHAASLTEILNCYNWCTTSVYFNIPYNTDSFANAIIARMKKDKKNRGGMIRLVLQEDILKTQVREVDTSIIREVLI